MPVYVVSACLAGHPCRYDGGSNPCPAVMELVRRGEALPLCPEGLAELPVPRPPCEVHSPQGAQRALQEKLRGPALEEVLEEVLVEVRGDIGEELEHVKVVSKDGRDVSAAFAHGARLALEATLAHGCTRAILKARSPSCGIDRIYDGTFSKRLIPGMGLWARLLAQHGVELFSEEQMPQDL